MFFFASRRRQTRYWRDWSSDVCSSDLRLREERCKGPAAENPESTVAVISAVAGDPWDHPGASASTGAGVFPGVITEPLRDRKSVVKGKSVDLGGGRIIKKKTV